MKKLIIVFTLICALLCPPLGFANNSVFAEVNKSVRLRQYDEAIHLLRPLLNTNNPKANYMMAGFYRNGRGVEKNSEQAIKYYLKAAESGHVKAQYSLATLLMKQGTSKNDDQVIYWYQQAANQGHKAAQKKLKQLSKTTDPSHVKVNDVFTAIRLNKLKTIEALIASGVSFEILDDQGRTPLQSALVSKHQSIARLIIKHQKQFNVSKNKILPLHLAIANGYNMIANDLIDQNVGIHKLDAQGNNVLFVAVRHNNYEIAKQLLTKQVSPLESNKNNSNAYALAKTLNYDELLNLFSQNGYQPKSNAEKTLKNTIITFQQHVKQQQGIYKQWPLINVASMLGETDIVIFLLENELDITQTDRENNSALHRAAQSGHDEIVKRLISKGYKINARNNEGETALLLAAKFGCLKCINILLEKGADADIKSKKSYTALYMALANKQYKSALRLIGAVKKIDILQKNLLLAIKQKQSKISLAILKKLPNYNFLDGNQRGVLWHSADANMEELTKTLLETKSTNINTKDINGYSALAQAINQSSNKVITLLLNKSADLNAVTNQNNSILMLAVQHNNKEVVKELLKKNVTLNNKNNSGNTALMIAAKYGYREIVSDLIKAKADLHLRNANDKNAYQIAIDSGNKNIAELIKKHSGRLFQIFN